MLKLRVIAVWILIAGILVGYFVYASERPDARFALKYGLDLAGGSHLVYEADTSQLLPQDIEPSMESLRDVIERRVNVFGVSEPLVQVEQGGFGSGEITQRLIVELPGITDVQEAIRLIGETPSLEFRLVAAPGGVDVLPGEGDDTSTTSSSTGPAAIDDSLFIPTGLTGRMLKRASVQFGTGGHSGGGLSNEPLVIVDFNTEGSELFAEITGANVGRQLAIFLDGQMLSSPVIQQEIFGGTAQITGNFTPEEARDLVQDLNLGALPVPIEIVSTQTIGASLGEEARTAGIKAGMIGLIIVALFLIAWYRLPGLIAVFSLAMYLLIMLALFKLVPVVITAAGIAGFVLSIGMAVDANILIFERMKEELRGGEENLHEAITTGFSRAWLSIRDGNVSSIITAIILFWFGTSLVKGFALTFGLGVVISMISAITITRTFLLAVAPGKYSGSAKKLFGVGFK